MTERYLCGILTQFGTHLTLPVSAFLRKKKRWIPKRRKIFIPETKIIFLISQAKHAVDTEKNYLNEMFF